jgi:hypothetical protein
MEKRSLDPQLAKQSNEYDGIFVDFTWIFVWAFMKWTYSSPGSPVKKEQFMQWLFMLQQIKQQINDVVLRNV